MKLAPKKTLSSLKERLRVHSMYSLNFQWEILNILLSIKLMYSCCIFQSPKFQCQEVFEILFYKFILI